MTSALAEKRRGRRSSREIFVNHYGSTEIYTFSIHRDQRAKPGCAGRAGAQRPTSRLDPRGRGRDHLPPELGRGVRRLLEPAGRRREGDPGRLVLHGRRRAGSTRTATCGSSAASTTWSSRAARTSIRSRSRTSSRAHPGVREVAVVGAPDDRCGQRVVAYVVARRRLTAEELDAFCLASDTLARFKRPREYRFVSELPKSPSGKILRRMLRERRVTEHDGFRVERDAERGVATITLDVPGKFNRVSMTARDELAASSRSSTATTTVRFVVLTGAGETFTAGRRHPRLPRALGLGRLATRRQRRRAGALPEAGRSPRSAATASASGSSSRSPATSASPPRTSSSASRR